MKKYNYAIFLFIAFFIYSLSIFKYEANLSKQEVNRVQQKLISAQKELECYANQAIELPSNKWLIFDNFPDDMVIYKYDSDTLQSWINAFPVGNDDVDSKYLLSRLYDLNNRNLYSVPLANLTSTEQYVNLGSSWYVTKTYRYRKVKIITGIKIKDEYLYNNKVLTNSINPRLGLDETYTTIPVNQNITNIIYGINGNPLFSINDKTLSNHNKYNSILKWISTLFFIISILSYHGKKRNYKSFVIVIIALFLIKIATDLNYSNLEYYSHIFSPTIYADNVLFNSLGDLLIANLLCSLSCFALYLIRKKAYIDYQNVKHHTKHIIQTIIITLTLTIIIYIHYTIASLCYNSNISLQLFKLNDLSIYSILIYLSYGMLFFGLLICIQFCITSFQKFKHFSLYKTRNKLIYIFIISLYILGTVSIYSFKAEKEACIVWTNKLASQRDIALEIELKNIEIFILRDPYIRQLINYPNGDHLILNRILELYLRDITQSYYINIVSCNNTDNIGGQKTPLPINCNDFFKYKIINNHGIALSSKSSFYFLNNYTDKISYLGAFYLKKDNEEYRLYIELDSKNKNETIGYPYLLLNKKDLGTNNIPSEYSYAKYYNKKLSSFKGRYNYATDYIYKIKKGYIVDKVDGYTHFINQINEDMMVAISRPTYKIFPYIISFSYTFLFFGGIIFLITNIWHHRRVNDKNQRYSFRKKIFYLVFISLIVALICMGVGSVVFTINLMNENNRIQMEEKLKAVQNTMSQICKYASSYNEINTSDMFEAMDEISLSTHVDLNLYDPYGRLIRSTKPEIFEQFLVSSRINSETYYKLIYAKRRQVINEEYIATVKYYALYAPIFNQDGTLIAIANIPYFSDSSGIRANAPAVIAAIINLFIIILIMALLTGMAISNSLTMPLAIINNRMKDIDLFNKFEHIEYKNKDELGNLVRAYNKMLDDLKASTTQLAQNEREQAWREMARQIAHEIKNPLTPMRLSIQHLMRMKAQGSPLWVEKFDALSISLLEQIEILSNTASEFSSFAKFYNEDNAKIDLVSLIKEQFTLFDNRENIKFYFNTELESAYIFAKKTQITRVLVNLISNAIQAIEDKNDSIVKISLVKTDDFYKIDIEDNGSGIKNENLSKLFKPNFTTKSSGTGLGLAICKNIIEQSHGSIHYQNSAKLGGANFYIILPKSNI